MRASPRLRAVTAGPVAGALAVSAALAVGGCSAPDTPGRDGRLRVVTTVAPITSIVAAVGGDRVQLRGIVPEGTNSHTFEPAPKVAEVLSTADVIFVNGLKLEQPTEELARNNKRSGAEIVELGTRVLPEAEWIYDFSFPKSEGKPNPHLWTDPTYAVKYASVVRETLAARDPRNAAYYRDNFTKFQAKAIQLADALRKDQQTVPAGGLELLTYHDAYAYFARTFGWKVIGAIQPRNFEDPTPEEVARLIDQIRQQKVPVIFGSEVFPSSVLAEIGRATGARYEDTLRDDDLPGKPGEVEHSWLGLMRYDYTTMVTGLHGTAANLARVDVRDVAPDSAVYPQ